MSADYQKISQDGLWTNNVALIQLLGLCPLLAVTGTFINGLGLGLATLLTLLFSNVCVSAIRHWVRPEIRIPVFVLIIASIVTIIEMIMHAWVPGLYNILGIFIPLIVTNCSIIARAEAFAVKNPILPAAIDGIMMGLGFLAVLILLGGLREIIGFGTLFDHADLMFGAVAKDWVFVIDDYRGFLLAVLPPGAFIGLGLLIAGRNFIELRKQKTQKVTIEPVIEATS